MTAHILQRESSLTLKSPYVRDGFTWFSYILLGYGTYLQAMLGPLSSIFQQQFHLNYTGVGLPVGAFSVGVVLVSLIGGPIMRRSEKTVLLWSWGSGMGTVLGILLLMASQNMMMVVGSAFLMGASVAIVRMVVQGALASHQRAWRATALTEANVITSTGAVLAPLAVASFQGTWAGWRLALCCALVLFVASICIFRRVPEPALEQVEAEPARRGSGKLPRSFWYYWGALISSVALEWSIIVWSPFLLRAAGLDKGSAVAAVSLFFCAEAAGRLFGSRLTRRVSSVPLLLISLGIVVPAFLCFWLVGGPVLKLVSLFVCGLGVANLFPLLLATAIGTAPRKVAVANARLSLGSGFAVLAAPLLFGRVADGIGIQKACVLIFVLAACALGCIFLANRKKGAASHTLPGSEFRIV